MRYELTLFSNGNIEIVEIAGKTGWGDHRVVYHKTYDPSDDLLFNLVRAYKKWEKLTYEEDI